MSEINLLHQEASGDRINSGFAAILLARLLLILVVAAILIYAALYFYSWSTERKIASVKEQAQSMQAEAIANRDRNELITRQEQLTHLETLIGNHVYWSYLLPELARVTLTSARYTEIEADSTGKLNLAVSLQSYADVERYMQIFDLPEYNQQFSNVRIVAIDTVQKDAALETLLRLQLTFNPEYIKGRM